jgi:hypothetical protein
LQPLQVPMLPFVMLPRPLQESNVIGKGGTAGFLGRHTIRITSIRTLRRILNLADLTLRKEVSRERLERRSRC